MRWAALLAALGLASCGLPTGDTVVYPAGSPELAGASVGPDGVWESAPASPGSPWLPFPAQVTVEVEHGLGRLPRVLLVYVSFDAEGRESTLASGDLARIVAVDESTVSVRNATNARLFARIVLQ